MAFEAASRHATFSQAAKEIGVTPSAISHQILQLEDFLGMRLFRRHAGRALLTDAGHIYAKEIKAAFSLISNATNVVAPQSQTGHLVIAASPSFAAKWLQPRLPEFLRCNPDVRVRLSTLSNNDGLDKDRCDIAIVYGHHPAAQSHAEPLLIERLRPLCSPALAASMDLRTPGDLSRVTLIHSVNALTWPDYLRRIGSGDVRPNNELWLDRSTMAIDAAVAGLGVILESDLLAEQELRDGRLIAPFESQCFGIEAESYFLVRPAAFRNGPEVARFETWLRGLLTAASQTKSVRVDGFSLPSVSQEGQQ